MRLYEQLGMYTIGRIRHFRNKEYLIGYIIFELLIQKSPYHQRRTPLGFL